MAEEVNIDRISIEIEAAANRAVTPLNELADAMAKVRGSLTGMPSLRGLTDSLSSMSELSLTGTASDVSFLASSLSDLRNVTSDFPRLSYVSTGLNNLGESISTLSEIDPSNTAASFSELAAAIAELENSLPETPRIEALGAAFANLSPDTIQAARGLRDAGVGAASARSSFRGLDSVSKTLSKSFSGVRRWIKDLAKDFDKSAKGASIFGNSLVRAFGRIALYRALRTIIKEITDGFREGLTNLMQFSTTTGAAMNQLATESLYLKNTMGALVAPIVNALAPAFHILTDAIVESVNAVGMFIAAFTGAGTFVKAKHAFVDVAAAAKAANKEIKFMIGGFDELNQIPELSASDTGVPNIADMFEEVPIMSSILDFVDRLKEAFKLGDYENIGKIIAEEINKMIERIDQWIRWDNLGPKIMHGIDIVAGIVNGLVEELKWERIGETIADGVNTIAYSLIYWFDSINWDGIGQGLGRSLTAMVERIDWGSVGTAFAKYFNSQISVLGNLAATFDWTELGLGLSTGINKFFSTFDFKGLGKGINDFGVGILTTLIGTIRDTDWEQVGSNIASMLNEIKWPEIMDLVGTVIGEAFKGALDLLIGFAKKFDWAGLGEGIYDLLAGIDWSGIMSRLATVVGESLANVVPNAIMGFVDDAVTDIHDYWYNKMEETGGNLILGLYNGITGIFSGVSDWIKKNLYNPFMQAFKDHWGLSEKTSDTMYEIGEDMMIGWLTGMAPGVKPIITLFKDIIPMVKDVFGIKSPSTVFEEIGQDMLAGLFRGLGDFWDEVSSWGRKIVRAIKAQFDIDSPSRLFRDEIGRMLGKGMTIGLEMETKSFVDSMKDIANQAIAVFQPVDVGSDFGSFSGSSMAYASVGQDYIPDGSEDANSGVVEAIYAVLDALVSRPVISDSDIAQANITGSSKRGIVMSRNPAFTY